MITIMNINKIVVKISHGTGNHQPFPVIPHTQTLVYHLDIIITNPVTH